MLFIAKYNEPTRPADQNSNGSTSAQPLSDSSEATYEQMHRRGEYALMQMQQYSECVMVKQIMTEEKECEESFRRLKACMNNLK